MTERAKDWLSQWASPGIVINIVAAVLILGGAWVRLGSLEEKIGKLQGQVEALQTSGRADDKSVTIELVKCQSKIEYLGERLREQEAFKNDQTLINTRIFTSLSVLEKK